MSKTTSKQKYVQLKEWLASRGTNVSGTTKQKKRFSKSDYYKQTRKRYGSRSN